MTVRIERIRFSNFRVLRDAELPLGPLTVIVGPNGSGKSTVWEALQYANSQLVLGPETATFGTDGGRTALRFHFCVGDATVQWTNHASQYRRTKLTDPDLRAFVANMRHFDLQPSVIANAGTLEPNAELTSDGRSLSVVLDRLRDQHPEAFEALNDELSRWFPEFDRVLFDTPATGQRALNLRHRRDGQLVSARELSSGTRSALCLLTLAHLAQPPSLAFIEDPDAGVHPRLLQQIKDALVRLAYPRENDIDREPCQVIATTHSPYFLDLFRGHLDQVVIASRDPSGATFQRLSEYPQVDEILGSGSLGSAWFTGILGGIPQNA